MTLEDNKPNYDNGIQGKPQYSVKLIQIRKLVFEIEIKNVMNN